ncbi:hypothetical protein [Nocardia sp. NPDC050793]|uniref:hypothetical protein n=1 Tax=Nocardia sp. NPDC050793 TaxID=3155159 RepID=UPI003403E0D5
MLDQRLSDHAAAVVHRRNSPPRTLSIALQPDDELCAPEQARLRRHPSTQPKYANRIGVSMGSRAAFYRVRNRADRARRLEMAPVADLPFRRRPPDGGRLGRDGLAPPNLATIRSTRMSQGD